MTSTRAIETKTSGHIFRSRLEARWAEFFTLVGWKWTYEPFDAKGYIPDFLIHGTKPVLVEVKPAVSTEDYFDHVERIDAALVGHWEHDVLIVGVSPEVTLRVGTYSTGCSAIGLLGEEAGPDGRRWWMPGIWNQCGYCGHASFIHEEGSYASRPCSHHDGDHYLNLDPPKDVLGLWGLAHAKTRWNATARR